MIAEANYIKRRFNYFNALYFNSQLPDVPVKISHAHSYVGQFYCGDRHHIFDKACFSNSFFRFSDAFDIDEDELDDVILHEMIHLYIKHFGIKDNAPHGNRFRSVMNMLNEKYGRHIRISIRGLNACAPRTIKRVPRFVCVALMSDGRVGITVAARSRVFSIWRAFERSSSVKRARWFLSDDPFFASIPKAIRPKVYFLPAEKVEVHLAGAKPLERRGGIVSVAKK